MLEARVCVRTPLRACACVQEHKRTRVHAPPQHARTHVHTHAQPDYSMVDTLFSIAESYLFSQLVELAVGGRGGAV